MLLLAANLGGSFLPSLVACLTFATVLAVVAGLTLAAATSLAHDICGAVITRGHRVRAARAVRDAGGGRGGRDGRHGAGHGGGGTSTSPSSQVWPSPWPPRRSCRPCRTPCSGRASPPGVRCGASTGVWPPPCRWCACRPRSPAAPPPCCPAWTSRCSRSTTRPSSRFRWASCSAGSDQRPSADV
ncbi:hypothetical protein [Streptomyces sp. SD31]|uniref:hypothetical protein n=1 Tax=Streptomyces sp. SD31 TaxID=3452208 RepID=UPI003F8BC91D